MMPLQYLIHLAWFNSPIQKNLLWISDLKKNRIGQDMHWDKLINDFDASYN